MQHAATNTLTVTVDLTTPIGVSKFSFGASHVQSDLSLGGDPATMQSAQQVISQALVFENMPIMGWGANNPEPSAGSYDWNSLDDRMQFMQGTTTTKMITLCCAPDWMKGGTAGQTNWSNLESAPLPSHYADFAELAKQVAMRYPNVQYFQVWNELKGFYDSTKNRWNYEGYTQLYNYVYDAIKSVRPDAKIGGPYAPLNIWADKDAGGWPATDPTLYNQPWGTIDQRPLDAITYWLANKHGGDFILFDGGTGTREGTWLTDEYNATSFYQPLIAWIRKQPNGGATIPVASAEFYANTPQQYTDINHYNAVLAHNLITLIKAGYAYALAWGTQGDSQGLNANPASFMTSSGQPSVEATMLQALKTYFPPGTQLDQTTASSNDITVLASQAKTMLVNHLNIIQPVTVNGMTINLNPYQVAVIDTPITTTPTLTLTPTSTVIPTPTLKPTIAPSLPSTNTPTPLQSNLLQNNSFENTGSTWLNPWSFKIANGASGSISHVSNTKVDGNYSVNISITKNNKYDWYGQLMQGDIPLTSGRTYTFSFWAKASKNRTIRADLQQGYSPFTTYFEKTFNLTTSWKQYTTTFTQSKTDGNTLFDFNFANATGQIWIDKISLQ